MRECATVGKLLEKVWSHPLPRPTARPSGTAAAEHEKGKQFSFTGESTPAKIFLFVGCYIGGRVHPSKGVWTSTGALLKFLAEPKNKV